MAKPINQKPILAAIKSFHCTYYSYKLSFVEFKFIHAVDLVLKLQFCKSFNFVIGYYYFSVIATSFATPLHYHATLNVDELFIEYQALSP